METQIEESQLCQGESNRPIVRENYQLAMEYLEDLFINELSNELRSTWAHKDSLDAILQFYIYFINRLPYHKDVKIKGLRLNYSEDCPLTYPNRHKIHWILELDEEKEIKAYNVSRQDIWDY